MTIEQNADPGIMAQAIGIPPGADGQPVQMGADSARVRTGDEPAGSPLGSRSLEISNAISRLHKEFVGRGPANSRTTIDGDLVVVLLQGGYTRAEQTLTANDNADLVAAGRLGLQDAMRQAMIAAVEETIGRRVHSFMSANDLIRNLQVEVFVLATEGRD
jgi:uncharacterized protein YbcI